MATPPTRVSYHVQSTSPFLSTGTPKTCTGVTFQVGDFLEVKASAEQHGTSATVTPTLSAGAATWTKYADQGAAGANNSGTWSWVGVVTTAASNVTVSLARPTGSNIQWGFTVSVIRGSSGIGVRFEGNNGTASGAPGVTQVVSANSLLTCQVNDWNATDGTTRTWRTVNGSPITEASYYRRASTHTVYGGYVADSGSGGSVTMGLTAPATQRWVMSGFEFLGSSGGGTYAGNVSASVPRVASSITGSTTVPLSAGSVSAATPKATVTIAGTTTSPTSTGNISASAPVVTASIAGTTTVPTYTGTLTASTIAPTASISGTATAPGSTGSVNAATPLPTAALTGTATPPVYSGAVAASTSPVAGSVAGTTTAPTYSGTVTAQVPPTRATITGTVTVPAGSATLSGTVPRVTGSMSGAVTAPTWGGTLAGQLARTTATMLGAVTGPAFLGTVDGILPKPTTSLAGTTTSPVVGGALSATTPRLVAVIAGSFVADPTYVPPELVASPVPPTHTVAAVPSRFTVTTRSPATTAAAVPPRYTARSLP